MVRFTQEDLEEKFSESGYPGFKDLQDFDKSLISS
jgi:hypothetical protein